MKTPTTKMLFVCACLGSSLLGLPATSRAQDGPGCPSPYRPVSYLLTAGQRADGVQPGGAQILRIPAGSSSCLPANVADFFPIEAVKSCQGDTCRECPDGRACDLPNVLPVAKLASKKCSFGLSAPPDRDAFYLLLMSKRAGKKAAKAVLVTATQEGTEPRLGAGRGAHPSAHYLLARLGRGEWCMPGPMGHGLPCPPCPRPPRREPLDPDVTLRAGGEPILGWDVSKGYPGSSLQVGPDPGIIDLSKIGLKTAPDGPPPRPGDRPPTP